MMRITQVLILFFVLATLTNCKKAKNDVVYNKKYIEEIKQVRKEFSFLLGRNFIPGAQIAISKNGELIYSEAMGWASKDLEVVAKRDTKFRIGSLSELYTALIYLKMVEEGKLIPDSAVQHYLPDFPKKKMPVKLEHLLNHSSGIRELTRAEQEWTGINFSIKRGLEKFMDDPLMAPPGAYQQESRFNYNLLGAILENASNQKYHELLENYVTDTLKLSNTCPDNPFSTIKGRTNFYDHNMIAQVVNAVTMDMRWRLPSDGLLSTAEDLVKLGNVFLSSDYLNERTRENLFEPVSLSSQGPSLLANGWIIITDSSGRKVYGREGAVTGGSSSMLIYPDEELVVVVTTNLCQENSSIPIFKLARFFLPEAEQEQD
ncbi:serine hydrolase domain-containing protein [uncultured Draconibacterium sp.]|uniref:serine hydrolase domain-containing protein n=1 Tax=uncultured Draconibacterium sp. TaxID=1573823 RepID=UPI0025E2688C|nr:serine hydrolase domain-containing protein [uncultured Draconibacterium sp.]